MKLCTADQIRDFDLQTIASGTSGLILMERAGEHLCAAACQMFQGNVAGRTIFIVAGGGNNGGDGFVLARLLVRLQAVVQVVVLVDPENISGDANVNFDLLTDVAVTHLLSEVEVGRFPFPKADLVVDCLLGTGLGRPVLGRFASIINWMNQSGLPVLAVDIPSGIDADTGHVVGVAVKAERTVTFQLLKQGMVQFPAREYVGEVSVVDIGIDPELICAYQTPYYLTHEYCVDIFPDRQATGHKGSFGHLFMVAGSIGKTGAAVLSALGALRSGAGLVSLAVPSALNSIFETHLIEAMTIPVTGSKGVCFHNNDFNDIMSAACRKGCVVIGPGLGTAQCTGQLVNQLVCELAVPLVLDADGLNVLELSNLLKRNEPTILTPHPGEMARLTGKSIAMIEEDRVAVAREFSQQYGVVVVLKGAATVIAAPDGALAINSTGNAGMGTGGMGDVLSGIIAAFLARGLSSFDAACLGVYSHGRAGDLLVEAGMPFGYLASELADALPDVWQEFQVP